jgi:hypothetical protein
LHHGVVIVGLNGKPVLFPAGKQEQWRDENCGLPSRRLGIRVFRAFDVCVWKCLNGNFGFLIDQNKRVLFVFDRRIDFFLFLADLQVQFGLRERLWRRC